MSDRSVSRGEVISLIAGIPLAVTATASAATAADALKPVTTVGTPAPNVVEIRAKYKYVDKSPNPVQGECATCYAFRPVYGTATPAPKAPAGALQSTPQRPILSATCTVVPGPISPGGWCTAWGLNPSLKMN